MTLADLGKVLKEKYPEYAELRDYEAGELLIKKYPEYVSMLDAGLQQAHAHETKKTPLFVNRAIAKIAEQAVYNQVVTSHFQAPDRAKRTVEEQTRAINRVTEAAELTHENQSTALKFATSLRVDVQSSTLIRTTEETNRINTENTERLNRIELDKQERLKKIDYEHEQRMFHAKVGSAVDYANAPHLIWMRKNQDLKNLYREVDDTAKDDKLTAAVRGRTIKRIEAQIKKLEAEIDGLGGQAVSEDSGQES